MTARRYTGLHSEAITQLLDESLAEIARDIGGLGLAGLAGVLLGGGYGRGEGGLLQSPEGDRLYNDLDFFVFTRHANAEERGRIDRAMETLASKWSARLHVSVDFANAKNIESLGGLARRLMYQELLHGWCPVWGDLRLEDFIPDLPPDALPVTEALRLLLNRGMGLVLAAERLHGGPPHESEAADFIVRNMNKAVLGCGDALLIAAGRYCWRGAERIEAFRTLAAGLPLPAEAASLYEEAYRFKLAPNPVLPQAPWATWQTCRDLWLATVRHVAAVAPDASPEAVRHGLHAIARQERSLRHLLRWFRRTRHLRPLRELLDAPVVTVLARLYGLLSADQPPAQCPADLRALWNFFN